VKFLTHIDSPDDLRKLDRYDLAQVADEMRDFLMEVVSEKGGHLASNLGSVELTVGLHYVFDTPRDKIVWDVGHQAYGHKILTGRRDRFHTIRQYEGLSGFTSRAESPYDHFGAGHASTSISAALGIAEAIRHKGLPNMSIAVIGDGSLTGGLVYEAMNNAGHVPAKNLLVVFNDNDMSIDPNVGALNKFINHAVAHRGYNLLRKEVRSLILSLQQRGLPLAGIAARVRKSVKNFFTPGMLFECFGFRYFGPVNGHDIQAVVDSMSFIKKEGPENGPYLLHVLTTKGKGYKLAEDNPVKYHGVGAFKIHEGIQSTGAKKLNYQDVFANTLVRLAKSDDRILAITAAMPSGTGLTKFQKEIPGRFYDVGIAESHAVLFAAGLATEGFRPVVAIYSTFLQRAYDQIIHDVCLQKLPVIFAMDRAGLVGADGATHQGAFDLSYLRAIPNIVIMAPKDEAELQNMIKTSIDYTDGPIAFRYPRGEVAGVTLTDECMALPIGQAELIGVDSDKLDILIVAVGTAVQSCLEVQTTLRERGYTTGIINARFIKPLDEKLILHWAKASKLVVTVEENSVCGGFGAAVLECFARYALKKETLVIGMPDRFIDHASPQVQRELCQLDPTGITTQCLEKLGALKIQKNRHFLKIDGLNRKYTKTLTHQES
jgi:1-deoxy-D-xylulose-5-phosphate synthase